MNSELLGDLIELGQGSVRTLDCVIAEEVENFPAKESLLESAKRAQSFYPTTLHSKITTEDHQSLEDFANIPLMDKHHLVLGLIREGSKKFLALKMSHALGDALSMLMWLRALCAGERRKAQISFRSFPPKKDTPYRERRNSEVLFKASRITSRRRVETFTLSHELPTSIKLNDVLLLALLRSLPGKRKAIWVPVNVREHFLEGFGNGLSRLRIYPSKVDLSTREELMFIRKQKQEALSNGEVSLPPPGLDLSSPVKKNLFRLWLKRPWADWASLSLSHLEDREGNLSSGAPLWGVTNLIEKHNVAFFAFTQKGQTFITVTFDDVVPRENILTFISIFKNKTEDILYELRS